MKKILCALLSLGLAIQSPALHAETGDDLPDIGAAADSLLSPAEEKRLGQEFMRWVHAKQKVMDDPVLEDYLKSIGDRLVNVSDGEGSHFRFFLVDQDQINAYAGPGGYIGVHTGLIHTTESESELASVLAHEITHVNQRHLIRAWHEASSTSLLQAGALLAGLILGAAAGGDAAIAATMGAQAVFAQQRINFTRANEQEADRIGISLLYEAGFDPRAMPVFFERMGRANKANGTQLPEFLRTHPVTNTRISDAMGRAEQFEYRQYADSLRYHLARAAILEHGYADPKDAIKHFRESLNEGRYRNKEATQYGLALALLRDNQLQAAQDVLAPLVKQNPQVLEFPIADARIRMEQGDYNAALSVLEQASLDFPLSYPVHITLAEAQLRAGKGNLAYDHLKKIALLRKEDPNIYKLLSRAASQVGRVAESHEHLSTHYYLTGSLEAAKHQLDIALRTRDLPYFELSRLESKRKQVQDELDELKRRDKEDGKR